MTAKRLESGDRAPNFDFVDRDGKNSTLYNRPRGGPMVLYFLPGQPNECRQEVDAIIGAAPEMISAGACLFAIGPGTGAGDFPEDVQVAPDEDGEIVARFGADGRGHALVLDPNLRVFRRFDADPAPLADRALPAVRDLPRPDRFVAPRHPPVLSIPRVLSPDQCRRLIDYFHSEGSSESGTYTLEAGAPVRKIDHKTKRRRDCMVRDPAMVEMLSGAMGGRVFPEIQRAFQAKMTRVEELKIVRYDSEPGGYFRPHRDNTLPTNAHRRFAITLNLNAEDYEGGRLRFPEYGGAAYKPATGEAVVFSCSMMHEATDVVGGVRYVLLSFLYDEQGEEMRQAVRRQMAAQQAGG